MLLILAHLDKQFFTLINTLPHAPFLDVLAGGLWGFGLAGVWWLFIILQQWFTSNKRKFLIFLTVTAFSSAYTVSELLLKELFQKPRPGDIFPEAFIKMFGIPSPFSFPSSHAAVSFAMAYVLSNKNPVLLPLNFGFAAIIAFTRVYIGLHFPSDIIYGALIGTIIGWIVVKSTNYVEHVFK